LKEHRGYRQRGTLVLDNPKKIDKIERVALPLLPINEEERGSEEFCEAGRRIH
jgi:hypothetical protein